MKFAAIAEYRHLWPLAWMCEIFEVTRAGFYAWLKRPRSARELLDIEQTVLIRASFADSDQTYGARRVRRDLRDWGHRCGVHRIERLMGLARLEARRKRRRMPFDLGTRCEHSIAAKSWIASSMRRSRTASGPQTSPISGPRRVGFTSPSSWICSPGVRWVGR